MTDIINKLRIQTIPTGYEIHMWKQGDYTSLVCYAIMPCIIVSQSHYHAYAFLTMPKGKTESYLDKLRSIVAQLEFARSVRYWHDEQGIHFRTHFYYPEHHPITGQPFHEREDAAHVFKVYYCVSLINSI